MIFAIVWLLRVVVPVACVAYANLPVGVWSQRGTRSRGQDEHVCAAPFRRGHARPWLEQSFEQLSQVHDGVSVVGLTGPR